MAEIPTTAFNSEMQKLLESFKLKAEAKDNIAQVANDVLSEAKQTMDDWFSSLVLCALFQEFLLNRFCIYIAPMFTPYLGLMLQGTVEQRCCALAYFNQTPKSPLSDSIWQSIINSCFQQQSPLVQAIAQTVVTNLLNLCPLTYPQLLCLHSLLSAQADSDWSHSLMPHPQLTLAVNGPSLSQVVGCFIGQCVGDSLGFCCEGAPADFSQEFCNQFVSTLSPPVKAKSYPFGQITDDSQLCRELILSVIECKGKFDPQNCAVKFAAMFAPPEPPIVGMGKTTENAAKRVLSGVEWNRSGITKASGNGSAMRVGIVGAMAFHSDFELQSIAVDQSKITHNTSKCHAGAIIIASAVKLALSSTVATRMDVDSFIDKLIEVTAPIDEQVSSHLQKLKAIVFYENRTTALLEITSIGKSCNDSLWHEGQAISSSVTQAVFWALFSFLRHPTDFVKCVVCAISGGGDTDTTAAMAGAICGAHTGIEAIPEVFVKKLHDKDAYDANKLIEIATELHALIRDNKGIKYREQ